MQSLTTSRVAVGQLALHGGGAVGVDGGCTWHSHVRNNLVGEFGQANSGIAIMDAVNNRQLFIADPNRKTFRALVP